MKKIIRLFVPPFIWLALSNIKDFLFHRHEKKDDYIFDGQGDLFVKSLTNVSRYAEYGVGRSTLWVHKNTNAIIKSVDTSNDWINVIKSKIGNDPANRVTFQYFDVGPLSDWGRPKDFSKKENFLPYINSIWDNPDFLPQLVLIDGRFRIACFLNALLKGEPGTVIIFDDYKQRPEYHVVEEILKPTQRFGRQALFVIPESLDKPNIQQLFEKFVFVTN